MKLACIILLLLGGLFATIVVIVAAVGAKLSQYNREERE